MDDTMDDTIYGQREMVQAEIATIATLKAENQRLSELLWGSRCIYCGEIVGKDRQNQDQADEILKAHILACEKHPVSVLKAQNEALQKERNELLDNLSLCKGNELAAENELLKQREARLVEILTQFLDNQHRLWDKLKAALTEQEAS